MKKQEHALRADRSWKTGIVLLFAAFCVCGLSYSVSIEKSVLEAAGSESYGRIGQCLSLLAQSLSSDYISTAMGTVFLTGMILWVQKQCFSAREKILAVLFSLAFSGMQLLAKAYST